VMNRVGPPSLLSMKANAWSGPGGMSGARRGQVVCPPVLNCSAQRSELEQETAFRHLGLDNVA
jgi:hypothetical protein